jgi:hypothetical protein
MEKDDEMKERLGELTDMITHVYLPLMQTKADTRLQLEKFVRQVGMSVLQAYGNVTLRVPPLSEHAPAEELSKDPELIKELEEAVVSIFAFFYEYSPHFLWTILISNLFNEFLSNYSVTGDGPLRKQKQKRKGAQTTPNRLKEKLNTGDRGAPHSTLCINSLICQRSRRFSLFCSITSRTMRVVNPLVC